VNKGQYIVIRTIVATTAREESASSAYEQYNDIVRDYNEC